MHGAVVQDVRRLIAVHGGLQIEQQAPARRLAVRFRVGDRAEGGVGLVGIADDRTLLVGKFV